MIITTIDGNSGKNIINGFYGLLLEVIRIFDYTPAVFCDISNKICYALVSLWDKVYTSGRMYVVLKLLRQSP